MLSQAMANTYMHFDAFTEHSSVSVRKYEDFLSILIKEFGNRYQDNQKKLFFLMFATPFSVNINTLAVNFEMEWSCSQILK